MRKERQYWMVPVRKPVYVVASLGVLVASLGSCQAWTVFQADAVPVRKLGWGLQDLPALIRIFAHAVFLVL